MKKFILLLLLLLLANVLKAQNESQVKNYFEELPNELKSKIFGYLSSDKKNILAAALASKSTRDLIYQEIARNKKISNCAVNYYERTLQQLDCNLFSILHGPVQKLDDKCITKFEEKLEKAVFYVNNTKTNYFNNIIKAEKIIIPREFYLYDYYHFQTLVRKSRYKESLTFLDRLLIRAKLKQSYVKSFDKLLVICQKACNKYLEYGKKISLERKAKAERIAKAYAKIKSLSYDNFLYSQPKFPFQSNNYVMNHLKKEINQIDKIDID